ncbi:MAG: PAS domain-containing protein [Lacunisphaera sp.]
MDRPGSISDDEEKRREEERRLWLRRGSDQLHRSLIESLNQGIYVADARNRVTYCNPAMCQIGGYPLEEMLGTVCFRHIAPEDRREVMRKIAGWSRDPAVREVMCEFRVVTRAGRKFWVEQSTNFVRDEDGRVLEARNSLRDISERKQAETALRDSERQFKGLFEESPIPIILLDAAGGQILEVNKAAMETFGYTREEVLGKTTLDLGAWPDPRERDNLIKLLQTRGSVRGLETTMHGSGGRLVHVLYNATQITIRGQLCLLNSVIDITNLKRAEQLFHDLFAFSPDALHYRHQPGHHHRRERAHARPVRLPPRGTAGPELGHARAGIRPAPAGRAAGKIFREPRGPPDGHLGARPGGVRQGRPGIPRRRQPEPAAFRRRNARGGGRARHHRPAEGDGGPAAQRGPAAAGPENGIARHAGRRHRP